MSDVLHQYSVTVNRVVDGDTLDIDIDLGFNVVLKRKRVRLAGIDTPELRSKNTKEIKKANEAKKVVEYMILNKIVYLKLEGEDKYGRILANIYINNINLNQYLIENKYAYKYEGGKKIKFTNQY